MCSGLGSRALAESCHAYLGVGSALFFSVRPSRPTRQRPYPLSVRHLERFPINTPYGAIFERVSTLFSSAPLPGNPLVVDQTAVGDPVVQCHWALKRIPSIGGVKRVVITNGVVASLDAGIWQIPKKDLVGALQILLQEQRLKIAAVLPEVPTLFDQMLSFQIKPAPMSTDPLAAWREGLQDDLVFAIGIAAWWIEQWR